MFKRILLAVSVCFFSYSIVFSQTTISTQNNTNGYSGTNGIANDALVTFVVKNTNSTPVFLNDIAVFKNFFYPLANSRFQLWYSSTSLSGIPDVQRPVWDSIQTNTVGNFTQGYGNKVFSDLLFLIPANTQYRFALFSSGGLAVSGYSTGGCSPSILTDAGVELILGDELIAGSEVGYAGATGVSIGGIQSPRWFTGEITVAPASACSGTPTAGTVETESPSVCYQKSFVLDVPLATKAMNIHYSWDSSSNGTTWFPIANSDFRKLVKSQSASSYYRCNVLCGVNKATTPSFYLYTPPAVSGTYTINASIATGGTNFNSFGDAINHIKCGINGPVLFNVVAGSGPYDEHIVIPEISGASATNTITFRGNGETVSYTLAPNDDKSVIRLDGADWVTLDSFTIDASLGTNGWGVLLTNAADHNTINKCNITTNAISVSQNFVGIISSASSSYLYSYGNNANYTTISNNKISGGYFSISLVGAGGTVLSGIGNTISNNTLLDMYSSAVNCFAQTDELSVYNNDISRPNRTNSGYYSAINISGISTLNASIQANKIHDIFQSMLANKSAFTGIYLGTDAALGQEIKVINNIIYNISNDGFHYGITNNGTDFTNIYHNSIVLDDNVTVKGLAIGFSQSVTAYGVKFRNNLVVVTRSGTGVKNCISLSSALSDVVVNNNAYYFNPNGGVSNAFGVFGSLPFATFADWKTANGNAFDQGSVEGDPNFVDLSNGNLTPTYANIGDIGANLGVATDITGVLRTTTPDPGAFEFTSTPCSNPVSQGVVDAVTNVCSGNVLSLGLSGNSVGSGQTYLWEKSASSSGPWTSLQAASANPFLSTIQTVNTYYRCGVKCSTGTIAYTPVQLITTPGLMAGTYTINAAAASGGTNFQTFTEAINFISCGINGPVVFNVAAASGPYNENFVIPDIKGTSSTNTITINGNGNTVIFSPTANNNKVGIHIKGTKHLIIDSLNVDVSGSSVAGWGILLSKQADSNLIKRCSISTNSTLTSSNFIGIVQNASDVFTNSNGNNGNYNKYIGNKIYGGYYGIFLYGNTASGTQNTGNQIINNELYDFYSTGIYCTSQSESLIVRNNNLSRPNRPNGGSCMGIFISGNSSSALIEKNRIHNFFDAAPAGSASSYGIYISADAKAGFENRIINNVIYNVNNDGFAYGITASGSDSVLIYHNTIVLDEPTSTKGGTIGFSQTGLAKGIEFKNNICYITRSGTGIKRAIQLSSSTSSIISNNNVLYLFATSGTNNFLGQFGSETYSALSDWQMANGGAFDQQSQSFDPTFNNPRPEDYLPNNPLVNGIGANLGITDDINGVVRTSSPDPGAFEVSISGCVNPPIAGASIVNNANICPNVNFTLNTSGGTSGVGQTFQWEVSANGNTGWTALGTAALTPVKQVSQVSTNYYRCAVQCNGGTTVYSTKILITTPSSVSRSFTVDNTSPSSATNFQNFTDAINFVSCGGLGGPVTLTAVPGSGPYNERVTIPQILGSSSTNKLTILGNGVTLNYKSMDASYKAAITLDGADNVIIDSLNIEVDKGLNGWGVFLTNQAENNIVRKCIILSNSDAQSTAYAGIVCNGAMTSLGVSGNNANNNLFENNQITGGYYGIYLYGNSNNATQNNNNIVRNNIVSEFYSYAIFAQAQSTGLVIESNDISRLTRLNSGATAGVYIATGCSGLSINKNRIHGFFTLMQNNTSQFQGIYMGSKGKPLTPNKVINNAIYDINGSGSTYGIYNSNGDTMQAYHNSIIFDNTNGSGSAGVYGFYQTGTANAIEFKNNLISITRASTGAKRCYFFASGASSIASDYNSLYINSAGANNHLGTCVITNYTTLAAWQASACGSYDLHSVYANPLFTSSGIANGDFMPTNDTCKNKGLTLGILSDINENTRPATLPTSGAFEYVASLPVTMTQLFAKAANGFNALNWTTFTEANNTGFAIEKSIDGINFERIAFVNSKASNGNSSNQIIYNYNDYNLYKQTNYYRLKQIDINNKYAYSNVVVVRNGVAEKGLQLVSVYPNPVINNVNVALFNDKNTTAKIVVTDVSGKQVMIQNVALTTGFTRVQLNTSALAKGLYIVKVDTLYNNASIITKIIKL